jgi:hypothetical protein
MCGGTPLRRSPAACRWRVFQAAAVVLAEGQRGSGAKPTPPNSATSCGSVRKHCGSPENCVNTKGSAATGSVCGEKVFREKVNTNRPAPGLATRAASPIAGTARRNAQDSRCHARSRDRSCGPAREYSPSARGSSARDCRGEPPASAWRRRRASATRDRCRRPSSRGERAERRCARRRSRGRARARSQRAAVPPSRTPSARRLEPTARTPPQYSACSTVSLREGPCSKTWHARRRREG